MSRSLGRICSKLLKKFQVFSRWETRDGGGDGDGDGDNDGVDVLDGFSLSPGLGQLARSLSTLSLVIVVKA